MKKQLNLLLILLFVSIVAEAQNDSIFALKITNNANATSHELVSVNTVTGGLTSIVLLPGMQVNTPKAILNPNDSTYNFVATYLTDSLPRLFSVNVINGQIETIPLNAYNDVVSLELSTIENVFYYIGVNVFNNDASSLFKIDMNAGISSFINTLPFYVGIVAGSDSIQNTAFNEEQNHLHVFAYPDQQVLFDTRKIYTVNVSNGTVVNEFSISDRNKIHNMLFNYQDNKLYGLEVVPNQITGDGIRLISIDDNSGNWTTTAISPIIPGLTYNHIQRPVFSNTCSSYTFLGQSNGSRINQFDLNGQFSSSSNTVNVLDMSFMAQWYENPCNPVPLGITDYNTSFGSCNANVYLNYNGDLNIDSDNEWFSQVTMFNLEGKEVLHQNIGLQKASTINLNGLYQGLYILSLEGNDCQVSKKIVIH